MALQGEAGLDVAVVGAGIAGLSAAAALSKAGHHVTVYERSRFKSEAGAAIIMAPNATRILRSWAFNFKAAGALANNQLRRVAADTLKLDSEANFDGIEEEYGSPWLLLHRADLHQGLRTLLESCSNGATIQLASGVSTIDCDAATLTLSDGSTVQKDFIVVADGAHCQHLPNFVGKDVPIVKTPLSIYRFLVPMKDVMDDPNTKSLFEGKPTGFTVFYKTEVGRPGHLLQTFPCRGGDLMYCGLMHLTKPEEKNIEGWDSPASLKDCLKAANGFAPALISLIEKATDVKVYNQMFRPSLPTFVKGKAALIGDSAHLMLPVHAQGASASIEDAAALGVLLKGASSTSLSERLELFNQLRHPRATATQALSNFMLASGQKAVAEAGKYYKGGLPPADSKTFSKEINDFFFSYDVIKDAEQVLSAS